MAMEFDLAPPQTLAEENGEGEVVDISASSTRTFFCILEVTQQMEQESLDVSIWASADGANWGTHPALKMQQQFYRGESRAVLDLSYTKDAKFIRARWELNRWGRGAPLPRFRFGLHLSEVPAMPRVPKLEAAVSQS